MARICPKPMSPKLRIGTRRSPLALIQTQKVEDSLKKAIPDIAVEIVSIQTQGDKDKSSPLSEIGGKGVFIREIEQALQDHTIDIAVHSFKDITADLSPDLDLGGFLKPESQKDALLSKDNLQFYQLPTGARIGTGSQRRAALLKKLRPDIQVIPIRGNVQTRINKIQQMDLDGVILSHAGLIRLGLEQLVSDILDPIQFTPAPGQGVIAIEIRKDDLRSRDMVEAISDFKQLKVSQLEFEFLKAVGLTCNAPLGAYFDCQGKHLSVTIFLADSDLNPLLHETRTFLLPTAKDPLIEWGQKLSQLFEEAQK